MSHIRKLEAKARQHVTPRAGQPPSAEYRDTDRVDIREAAGMLGMSQRAVRNLAASGRLEVEREGEGAAARLLVSAASIERLRSERRGNPGNG